MSLRRLIYSSFQIHRVCLCHTHLLYAARTLQRNDYALLIPFVAITHDPQKVCFLRIVLSLNGPRGPTCSHTYSTEMIKAIRPTTMVDVRMTNIRKPVRT